MKKNAVRAAVLRVLSIAVVAAAAACTPLQVVTHTVTQTEASVPAGQYTLDPHHWSITFDVEHLKYSRFTMRFDRADAQLDWNAGGRNAS
jgi:polyisoprenoid-binding protein YceI